MSLLNKFSKGSMPYAFSKTLNRNVGVDEVERGLKCNCICIGCGMNLVSKQGDSNVHHFSHWEEADEPCNYSYWVSVRDIAAQILNDVKYIQYGGSLTNCYKVPFSNKLKNIKIYDEVAFREKKGMDIFFKTNIGLLGIYFLTHESARECYENASHFSKNINLIIDLRPITDNSIYTVSTLKDVVIHNPKLKIFASYFAHQKKLMQELDSKKALRYERLYNSKSIMDMNILKAFGINPIVINSFNQGDFSAINVAKIYYKIMYERFKGNETKESYKELSRDTLHSFLRYKNEYFATALVINKFYIYEVIDDKILVIGKCFKEGDEMKRIVESYFAGEMKITQSKEVAQEKYPKLF